MQPETITRTYRGRRAARRAIAAMSAQGYQMIGVTETPRPGGCLRKFMLGYLGAAIWKPRPDVTVTFRRIGHGTGQ